MSAKNFYPELPEVPYHRTSVEMVVVAQYANQLSLPIEVKRMVYCMFRNESANGTKGVNGNYAGIQADNARWTGLKGEIATCVRIDSGGALRRFICFDENTGYKDTFDFLCLKVQSRGMFILSPGVNNINDLVKIYLKKWVGRVNSTPSKAELQNWQNLYENSTNLIF